MNTEVSGQPEAGKQWSWSGGNGALVWQLMFGNDTVMGIKRFPEQRKASLFCLEASTGRVLCDDFVLTHKSGEDEVLVGDGWMIGLETVHGGLLFCHTYQPGSPEHQGIWAVDLAAGRVAWSRPDLVFTANLGDALLTYRSLVFAGFPERDYWLVDPETGRELEHFGTAHERPNQLRDAAQSEEAWQGILLPDAALDEAGHVERIALGATSVTVRHRMKSGAEGVPGWVATLSVRAGDRLVHEAVMAAGEPMPVFNGFLMKDKRLYYIKEREVLVSLEVS
ncbi:DUF4905 domain-containing protein [Chlorobaculum sp. 24CR]|uniref:DUF4905 domain-containing protein n=1 Tax=Chlorobaculum sp. 24CR TaxID=2508878 RepID=UPI00100ABBCD|nr:DUF4905 domain-containing protein [Chlorobaculum sp. 24CR]RXK89124.1 DUF4905 domain-containing protein [Chlorobaculum sp. 24CR]